jgi:hypothetical protein
MASERPPWRLLLYHYRLDIMDLRDIWAAWKTTKV